MKRREFIAALGAAAAWPLIARSQQPNRLRRVGVLMSTADSDSLETASIAAFVEALGKLGWVENQNVELVARWGAGNSQHMTANARELVALAPDVLLVKGANVPAAREATTTIPIVFVVLSDTVAQTYVGSLARPAGNATGFMSYERELVGKRLTLLRELSPRIARVL